MLINFGSVAEWFNAPVLKTGVLASGPGVRILPLPPKLNRGKGVLMCCNSKSLQRFIKKTFLTLYNDTSHNDALRK